MEELKNIDFFNLESSIWIANKEIHVPAYDFKFEPLFKVSRPRIENNVNTIGRIGAVSDYTKTYKTFLGYGYKLINTPQQHILASELESWYPLIANLTPKSKVYEEFPSLEEFYKNFTFPVFIKGNRQTSKHNFKLSVAKTEDELLNIKEAYKKDSILHWQKIVIREFINLKPIENSAKDKVQLSYEFRTFWWKKELVGAGHYWSQYSKYNWTENEAEEAIKVARSAVELLNLPFVAIDLALTVTNKWIIIECNDAQESGYCGVNPTELWRNIIQIEET